MAYFPEEVVEYILGYVTSHQDRNAASLVCRAWYHIERHGRHSVLVRNCYAVCPERVHMRFPNMRALSLKGKPHFAEFNLVPAGWGATAKPWVDACARSCPGLEELRLKCMVVTDECLKLLSLSFINFKSLVLVCCEGFSTAGLANIATNCRFLKELDLQKSCVKHQDHQWINCFPKPSTSLECLNFSCLTGEVNAVALEELVARSPNLKSLRLNLAVPFDVLSRILSRTPMLEDLGFYVQGILSNCKIRNLTCLNLSYATLIQSTQLIGIIRHCKKLHVLWVLNHIGDEGLKAVSFSCPDLQELRVYPSGVAPRATVTEEGLAALSLCWKLQRVVFFCDRMTNMALMTIAKYCPRLTSFRLCILKPRSADAVTGQPLDEGFGAIVQSCKGLRRLAMSGLLTDNVFLYIGMYAEKLEMLSVAFAGDTDDGMVYVLNGCRNLKKLEIKNSPFSDAALLAGAHRYESMHSLWMSSCRITLGGCKALAATMPNINVEVIGGVGASVGAMDDGVSDARKVDKLYLYRTLAGPRCDAPGFVSIL